jgi:ornithine carbamoyltransferase
VLDKDTAPEGVKAYVGDGNNVAGRLRSAAKLGMKMTVASPKGYELDWGTIEKANGIKADSVSITNNPKSGRRARMSFIPIPKYMGMASQKKYQAFNGFQVNAELLKSAPKGIKIMHCLPAYRDYEITDEVVESPNSIIFDQSENRLHFQRALVKKLMS